MVILGNFFNHINTISELSIGKARKAWIFITKCCDAWVGGHGMSICIVMFSRMCSRAFVPLYRVNTSLWMNFMKVNVFNTVEFIVDLLFYIYTCTLICRFIVTIKRMKNCIKLHCFIICIKTCYKLAYWLIWLNLLTDALYLHNLLENWR